MLRKDSSTIRYETIIMIVQKNTTLQMNKNKWMVSLIYIITEQHVSNILIPWDSKLSVLSLMNVGPNHKYNAQLFLITNTIWLAMISMPGHGGCSQWHIQCTTISYQQTQSGLQWSLLQDMEVVLTDSYSELRVHWEGEVLLEVISHCHVVLKLGFQSVNFGFEKVNRLGYIKV